MICGGGVLLVALFSEKTFYTVKFDETINTPVQNSLSANLAKWSSTLKQNGQRHLPRICWNVFHYFVRLALKGLRCFLIT